MIVNLSLLLSWMFELFGMSYILVFVLNYHLVGLVVKAPASRVEHLGFKSCFCQDFTRWSHTNDLNIGTPVAALSGSWCDRGSAGTGWPGVSILTG